MNTSIKYLLATSVLVVPASGALTTNLVAYYDFEQTGSAGLANKAPGATQFNATRGGTGDWNATTNPSGPGFTGKADFDGGDGLSNRSALIAGNALNLVDARNEFVTVPLGTAQLGQTFTISAWHALTPGGYQQPAGPYNNSNRYHVLESSNNFDVSWGTATPVTPTTGAYGTYTYLAYVGEAPGGGFGPTGVTTGTWQHLVEVFSSDGTNTTLTVYLNGSLVDSRTTLTANMNFASLLFGRERNSPDPTGDRDWDGMMDEVAIWNRAIDSSEVTQLFNLGQTGKPVPEPSGAWLAGLGSLLWLRRRK